jgi:hypothetical protein
MASSMASAPNKIETLAHTKVIMKMTNLMERASTSGLTAQLMKAPGSMGTSTEKRAPRSRLMAKLFTAASGKMVYHTAMAQLTTAMKVGTRVNGSTDSLMVKALSKTMMAQSTKVIGNTGKQLAKAQKQSKKNWRTEATKQFSLSMMELG